MPKTEWFIDKWHYKTFIVAALLRDANAEAKAYQELLNRKYIMNSKDEAIFFQT